VKIDDVSRPPGLDPSFRFARRTPCGLLDEYPDRAAIEAGALAGRVDGFLGRLRPGQGVWRRNWLVHDVADLHLPTWVDDVERPTPVPEGRWLRSERQTLVRLPTVEAVVFTIRTQQVPMAVLGERPDVAGDLAAAIRGWSPEQRAYKGAAVDEALLSWLERVADRS